MIALSNSIALALSLPAMLIASCGDPSPGDSTPPPQATPAPAAPPTTPTAPSETVGPFAVTDMGTFDEPWAAAFAPGTGTLFITEKPGTMRFVDTATGRDGMVTGLPRVDYGGQGGLGDIAFLPAETANAVGTRTIYLTWAEAGDNDTRGAVLGRGRLVCSQDATCAIRDLNVIWRQTPKVTGRGHYSHRIAVAPDGQHPFVSSGDRQLGDPAQDIGNTLGTIVRLKLDGTAANGTPFADRGAPSDQIWSYGHRNVLGLEFDAEGRLWGLEHGPMGGDELNLVKRGANYGWPIVSDGDDYDGSPIPDHATHPEFERPVIGWTPVIAPGDFLFYSGALFPQWRGDALIANLKTQSIVRVAMDGIEAREADRFDFGHRLREIVQGPDGALFVLEDGEDGRLRKLTPAP